MLIEEKITGIAILLLLLISSSTESLLHKDLQLLLKNNLYVKHIILFCIIYFLIDFSDKINTNPIYNFIYSLIVYILFNLFTKQNALSSVIIIILIFTSFFIYTYKDFLINKNLIMVDDNNILNIINTINYIIYILIIIILLFGFIKYYIKKR
jgi:hypothetical protein